MREHVTQNRFLKFDSQFYKTKTINTLMTLNRLKFFKAKSFQSNQKECYYMFKFSGKMLSYMY